MAALLHSCFHYQRMLMRRMQGRRSLLQIGPTSRTRDSVWFLFPCQDFDPIRNLSKLIPDPLRFFKPAHFLHLRKDASVRPKKMFEANVVQTRFSFFAAAASGCN
jgi:hypothetical protein